MSTNGESRGGRPAGGTNQLSDIQKFQLWNLVSSMRDEIQNGPPITKARLAEKLSEKLGFTVGTHSLRNACLKMGVKVPRPHPGFPKGARFGERVAALEQRVSAIESGLAMLNNSFKGDL